MMKILESVNLEDINDEVVFGDDLCEDEFLEAWIGADPVAAVVVVVVAVVVVVEEEGQVQK